MSLAHFLRLLGWAVVAVVGMCALVVLGAWGLAWLLP
jgi:hypothetical protein